MALFAFMVSAPASTLVEYGMTGSNTAAIVQATTVSASLSVTVLTANSPLSLTNIGTAPHLSLVANPGVAESSLSLANTLTDGTYFSFTITPSSGTDFSLTSLSFLAAAGGSSTPRAFYVFSSIDGFSASNLLLSDSTSGTLKVGAANLTSYSLDLSGAQYQNLTEAVTFRIYIQSPGATSSLLFSDILVAGSVVPEPTTTALFALAFGWGIISRRRRSTHSESI